MTSTRLGTWHARKWTGGRPILEIDFCRHDLDLPAGLLLSTDWGQMRARADDLQRRIEMLDGGHRPDQAQV
jgi:hypothetical protein